MTLPNLDFKNVDTMMFTQNQNMPIYGNMTSIDMQIAQLQQQKMMLTFGQPSFMPNLAIEPEKEEEKISFYDWFKQNEKGFYNYCNNLKRTKITDKTYINYIGCFERVGKYIFIPDDLLTHTKSHISEKCINGFKKFLTYQEIELDQIAFNGFSFKKWRYRLNDVDLSGCERLTVKNISTPDLRKWYNDIKPKYKPLIYLMAVSGCRYSPLFRFLRTPKNIRGKFIKIAKKESPEYGRRHLKIDVVLLNIGAFDANSAKNSKKNGMICFPMCALPLLKNYILDVTDRAVIKETEPKKLNMERFAKQKECFEGDYTLKTIRKWFSNELINHGVPAPAVEKLTSKKPSSVLSENYLDLEALAVVEYAKIQKNLIDALPLPKL